MLGWGLFFLSRVSIILSFYPTPAGGKPWKDFPRAWWLSPMPRALLGPIVPECCQLLPLLPEPSLVSTQEGGAPSLTTPTLPAAPHPQLHPLSSLSYQGLNILVSAKLRQLSLVLNKGVLGMYLLVWFLLYNLKV